jgi:hypothetical protein
MSILLFLLGLLDIFAGIFYIFNINFLPIFIFVFFKGIWSFYLSIKSKHLLLLFLSLIDIFVSFFAMFSLKIEIISNFFAFLIILKGLVSLI